ncbi:exported hypothetical protein [Candidatus Sulfopaludibacter sp. SbA4]|nr:exported hypothetical protein [Candidatus Sulfopaludibacter sp. SbA4]
MKTATFLLAFAALVLAPAPAQVKITPGPEKVAIEINGKPSTDFYRTGGRQALPVALARRLRDLRHAHVAHGESGRRGQHPAARPPAPARPVVRPCQGQRSGFLEHRAAGSEAV